MRAPRGTRTGRTERAGDDVTVSKKTATRLGALTGVLAAFLLLFAARSGEERGAPLQVVYAYENPCGSCNEFEKWLARFYESCGEGGWPTDSYQISGINLYRAGAQERFDALCERAGVPREERRAPLLVIGDRYLVGTQAVETGMGTLFREQAKRYATK